MRANELLLERHYGLLWLTLHWYYNTKISKKHSFNHDQLLYFILLQMYFLFSKEWKANLPSLREQHQSSLCRLLQNLYPRTSVKTLGCLIVDWNCLGSTIRKKIASSSSTSGWEKREERRKKSITRNVWWRRRGLGINDLSSDFFGIYLNNGEETGYALWPSAAPAKEARWIRKNDQLCIV